MFKLIFRGLCPAEEINYLYSRIQGSKGRGNIIVIILIYRSGITNRFVINGDVIINSQFTFSFSGREVIGKLSRQLQGNMV